MDAADLLPAMKQGTVKSIDSIIHLDDFLKGRKNNPIVISRVESQQLKHVKQLDHVLKSSLEIWRHVENDDFLEATKILMESKSLLDSLKSFQVDQNQQLFARTLLEAENNLCRCQNSIIKSSWAFLDTFSPNYMRSSAAFASLSVLTSQTPLQVLKMYLEQNNLKMKELSRIDHFQDVFVKLFDVIFHSSKTVCNVFFFREKETMSSSPLILSLTQLNHSESRDEKDYSETCIIWLKDVQKIWKEVTTHLFSRIQNIQEVWNAINQLNLFLTLDVQKEWDSNCQFLYNKKVDVWQYFMKEEINHHFTSIWTKNFDNTFKQIKVEKLAPIPETVSFLWSSKDEDQLLKAKSFASSAKDDALIRFNISLLSILDDTKELLKLPEKKQVLIDRNDLQEMKSFFRSKCSSCVANMLSTVNQSIAKDSNNGEKMLSISALCRNLVFDSNLLAQCFSFDQNNDLWPSTRKNIIESSHQALNKYFTGILQRLTQDFKEESSKNSTGIEDINLLWDEKPLEEKDGKVFSTIRMPSYPSAALGKYLTSICTEINKVSGHGISYQVVTDLWLLILEEIPQFYTETRQRLSSNSGLSASIKQNKSVQAIFDLITLKQLFIMAKTPSIQKKPHLELLTQSYKSFESMVDPFDLHVLYPHIHSNVEVCCKNSVLLYGLLLMDVSPPITSKTSKEAPGVSSKPSNPNLMNLNRTCPSFPTLESSQ